MIVGIIIWFVFGVLGYALLDRLYWRSVCVEPYKIELNLDAAVLLFLCMCFGPLAVISWFVLKTHKVGD